MVYITVFPLFIYINNINQFTYTQHEKQRSLSICNTILIAEFAKLYNNLVMVVKCPVKLFS